MTLRILPVYLAAAACCAFGAVAYAATANNVAIQWTSPSKRIVLVAPDVVLSELDVTGTSAPRPDWTQAAQDFIEKDIGAHFANSGSELIKAGPPTPHEAQLAKLHSAVGNAILLHLYDSDLRLPNKGDALDWTLGPGSNELRDRYGADYALFVFVRDSYSSDIRRAVQVVGILSAAALGLSAVPAGGEQSGFVSLVDLRTGNIVWFNRLLREHGDLRTERLAQKTVDTLLKDIPL